MGAVLGMVGAVGGPLELSRMVAELEMDCICFRLLAIY